MPEPAHATDTTEYHDTPEEMLRLAIEVVYHYRTRYHSAHVRDGTIVNIVGAIRTSVMQDADALIAEAKALGIEFNKDRWL